MRSRHFVLGILLMTSALAIAVAAQQDNAPVASPTRKHVTQKQASQPDDEGERVFQQNCSRCHTAPDGFSPNISGTILRHMRVRASLSQHEEEQLLRFFNP